MSRQDKATTEKHARILRELVKKPENKVCGDCKRNDPRWASWNLGIFLCIRCSGIHRGMGTHISKIKSIDLDSWTPEQMESIQHWGNQRANLYWEAHLKAGHVPPDHKIESFIRSKYESRRWALDGPPPHDPSVLDDESAIPSRSRQPVTSTRPTDAPSNSQVKTPSINQPQGHTLLSTAMADQSSPVIPAALHRSNPSQITTPSHQAHNSPDNDLFNLDFHAPAPVSAITSYPSSEKKDVKQDILSLFSANPVSAFNSISTPGQPTTGSAQQSPWVSSATSQVPQSAHAISMMGSSGISQWGAGSGWAPPPAQNSLWSGQPTTQQHQPVLTTPSNVWATANEGTSTTSNDHLEAVSKKQDDVFGDLWGGFK